jgi:copper chaperone CopZ
MNSKKTSITLKSKTNLNLNLIFSILAMFAVIKPVLAVEKLNKDKLTPEVKKTEVADAVKSESQNIITKEATVKGMVCAFCVDTLKKVFSKQKEVETVQLDLDTKKLTLTFKANQNMDDSKIKKLIKSSGYDVMTITESRINL